ncbi:hypothetical protein BVRB_9g206250 [Beta vulgaris subsp. vulgaris]|uniref:F-box domain-containing protein n=1 Tax=Beta vulgaris subsp. vulgaris TaxID=3555 RepID=A0A0J8BQI6_BETVV|nr:F-box protein SNE [Beta vulgaris subsp. vulgaris]KMT02234.1 hypothetical protein BVRB_9g206250 [Beta vulgaris subsp. vulgaris]
MLDFQQHSQNDHNNTNTLLFLLTPTTTTTTTATTTATATTTTATTTATTTTATTTTKTCAEFKKTKKLKFNLNDHPDILVEVLKRLDGRSLGVAACVCQLWCSIATSDDAVWEHVCFRHVSPPPGVRPLVLALGGYKHLYMVCIRPVLGRLNKSGLRKSGRTGKWVGPGSELTRRVWTRQGAQLLLSLFCVDYYEKLGEASGGKIESDNNATPSSSLMFLCKPVNV